MASIKRAGFTQAQNQLSNIFKALGHPARLAIIEFLIDEEKIPCKNLCAELPISAPTVSRHTQILFESGIIGYEKIGNQTYYVLNPIVLETIAIYMGKKLAKNNTHETNYRNILFRSQLEL